MNAYVRICWVIVLLTFFGITSAAFGRPLISVTAELVPQNVEPDLLTPAIRPSRVADAGTTFYVSPAGDNSDGRSWQTAWNELDQIQWSAVRPGDTILLDGGTDEQRYETTLTVGANGAEDAPITIRRADEPGHDGQVVIFGGRSTPLPYCGQKGYKLQRARKAGIRVGNAEHVVIDGGRWYGIVIHGHNGAGVQLEKAATDVTLRNLHIYDNGEVTGGSPDRYGSSEGILLSGADITVERAIIHDNAADAIQSAGGVTNFTLRQSWLYNSRTAPNGETFNHCTHQDGIQIHNGGTQAGITITDSVIGPRLLQGIIAGNARTTLNDVTIRNTLFLDPDNVHIANRQPRSRNWTLEHVTMRGSDRHAMTLKGSGHSISDSQIDSRINSSAKGGGSGSGARITSPDDLLALGPNDAPVPTPTPNGASLEPRAAREPTTTAPAPPPMIEPPLEPRPAPEPSLRPWMVELCMRIHFMADAVCHDDTLALDEHGYLQVGVLAVLVFALPAFAPLQALVLGTLAALWATTPLIMLVLGGAMLLVWLVVRWQDAG